MHLIDRNQMTLSLTKEERKRIEILMNRFKLAQHAVVKIALRYFLFPKERNKMPIDGYIAVKEVDGEMVVSEPTLVVKENQHLVFTHKD